MSAFSRNLCSTASRTVRQRIAVTSRAVRPIAAKSTPFASIAPRVSTSSKFSTMAALKSGQTLGHITNRDFDPEIKDVASYVHNTPIESELAVGRISAVN